MGRIRTIKPEFPQSESMGRISRDARLCFVLLWTIVDDSGRTRGNSRMLASLLFPYDDDAPKAIPSWLDELEREGCLIRYEVDGNSYIEICKWRDHQKIDRPTASKLPPFEKPREDSTKPREDSTLDLDLDLDLSSFPADEQKAIGRWAVHYKNRTGQTFGGVMLDSFLMEAKRKGLRDDLVTVIDYSISKSAKSWIDPKDDYATRRTRQRPNGDHTSQPIAPVPSIEETRRRYGDIP